MRVSKCDALRAAKREVGVEQCSVVIEERACANRTARATLRLQLQHRHHFMNFIRMDEIIDSEFPDESYT